MRRFLYVNGQDISHLVLGLATEKEIDVLDKNDVGPEEYLNTVQVFLKENKLAVSDFEKIFVVAGPGSATALRSILSIVNSIKFVLDAKVFPIEKKADEQDSYTFKLCLEGKIDEVEHKKYFFPIYENAPKITLSTKDELGRAL
ncbi:hypothetical protein CO057_01990 [Candidatus Uhrbacteria bacterium CG_4_9_14_0_2_um_filter_41_50]|uniref:Gcp-like domain-containing protein n=1 Tax=Candidatus Uhrbacteria bacterium CG_4_9_14_0_2_um_filter_41_50 TaxID=1975031 RepID=A0A2M8EPF4_9BACT|nr:MAG: hypothetical protein COZ45_04445 [Candidatus Uhrbacteria bacterium CG_4_10_14_3_um_filter_41_21]PIZ54351.1 MAG: hypothetical protein COY24_03980 [Candidatus Uhrbacteria bacterium CG_4_10_14_0_2_um_filter_41_21]PJB84937.1 MAG: hypothetical protein CO086_00840 [Candidatus Uhrbacteria bacterium CG_4_9_14_0_8_um_filter_41_16]PJC24618.1 MAG: hypothetical protein CO057_01990 [Candidatus Uhrbacteria bacterium CG_4_9_14_0_2_um_filter_41_50]PJE74764.1 MAG: hypothetical protein COV03_03675 [Candi